MNDRALSSGRQRDCQEIERHEALARAYELDSRTRLDCWEPEGRLAEHAEKASPHEEIDGVAEIWYARVALTQQYWVLIS